MATRDGAGLSCRASHGQAGEPVQRLYDAPTMATPASQGTDRVVDILEALAFAGRPLTTSDLAATLGIHRSIVYRALQTLTHRRLVHRDEDGRYALGIGLMLLANSVSKGFQEITNAELASLANATAASVMFSVESEGRVMCLLTAEPRNAEVHLSMRLSGGHIEQIERDSAPAMALLLGRPPAAVESAVLKRARKRGFIEAPSVRWPGISMLAAPVRTIEGYSNASVCLLFSTGNRDINPQAVLDTAATLSERFVHGKVSLPFEPGPTHV